MTRVHDITATGHAAPLATAIPLWLTASLQDDLLTASNDLDRLQRLLAHTCEDISRHFFSALEPMQALKRQAHAGATTIDVTSVIAATDALQSAVTALQFQDMASQLIAHTDARLRACADRLVREAMPDDEDGTAICTEDPLRPNPVTQDEIDAGSVELF